MEEFENGQQWPDDEEELFPPSQVLQFQQQQQQQKQQSPVALSRNELLEKVDPDHSLSIWKLDLEVDDQLVNEYVNLIDQHSFLPLPPAPEILATVEGVPEALSSSQQAQVKVINLFSSYLQNSYFIDNVSSACEKEVTLFNPKTRFLIPSYSLLPASYFKTVQKCKTNLALAMQLESVRGIGFTSELLLLRAYSILADELKNLANSKDKVHYEFKVLFNISKKNFLSKFKFKTIDWNKREGKVHASLPQWRKDNSEPPAVIQNRYAEELSKAVFENKVDFSKTNAHAQFSQLLRNMGEDNSNAAGAKTVQKVPPKNKKKSKEGSNLEQKKGKQKSKKVSDRVGVKEYDKLFPKKKTKRVANPQVSRNRQMSMHEEAENFED